MLIGGDLLGASSGTQTVSAVVSANAYSLSVAALLKTAGWDGVSAVNGTVTINSGVSIGATSTSAYALTVESTFPTGSTIALVNNGYIVGAGGAGANGNASVEATAGNAGGPCLYVGWANTKITNNGVMSGGGAGGAAFYGAPGGGGGGYPAGAAGTPASGWNSGSAGAGPTATSTVNAWSGGTSGSVLQPNLLDANSNTSIYLSGAGGAPGVAGHYTYGTSDNTDGYTHDSYGAGGGGGIGAAGGGASDYLVSWTSDTVWTPHVLAAGGAAGAYIVGNSNVTWVATGTRYGTVS